jgi:toxin HigB-1
MVNVAKDLVDLRIPPSNYLEPLRGNRSGQFSIRVNDQYRVCFIWFEASAIAKEVEIVDYH